jgi:hypothetical protein
MLLLELYGAPLPPERGTSVRTNNRVIGAGSAVVITMVMCTVPVAAQADDGDDAARGTSIGTAYTWTGPGTSENPHGWSRAGWEHYQDHPHGAPGNWPGRWTDSGGRPAPAPSDSTYPVTPGPTVTATDSPTTEPATEPATDPTTTDPATTDPTATATATDPTATATPDPSSSSAPAVSTGARSIPIRSGLPWASGVFQPSWNPADVEAFGTWRGAPVDVAVTWSARQTWDDIINPAAMYAAYKGVPFTMAFGVAPVPEGDASATMAGCAAGSYNDKWTQFGTNIVAAGLGKSVIRLGWEFNGNWYKWQAKDPNQFAECFRQIVGTVRKVAPDLLWDWTVNRGAGQSVTDARLAYPGDDYVDMVGIDSYDVWPGATAEDTWNQQYGSQYGLKFWADFAKQHGKKISVPEWGVYTGTASQGHNGGDNAFYVGKMEEFFKAQGSNLGYESYFNEHADYYGGAIYSPTQNPKAASEYKAAVASP